MRSPSSPCLPCAGDDFTTKRRARRFVVGHGTAETKAELQVGTKVTLKGVGKLFEGDFYLAAAEHLFDGAAGLRTEIELERPGLGKAA